MSKTHTEETTKGGEVGMKEFKRENKYLVLKWDDINKYLKMSYEFKRLNELISTIGVGRINDGKLRKPAKLF